MSSLNAFCELFNDEDVWTGVGWNRVKVFSGVGKKSWESICSSVREAGYGNVVTESGDWFKEVIVIKEQELFSMDSKFMSGISKCRNTDTMVRLWGSNVSSAVRKGIVKELHPHADNRFSSSKAWSCDVEHLSTFEVPSSLEFRVVAGILCSDRWFTEAHIEVCADHSISITSFGRKAFIYAHGVNASKWLVRTVKSVDSFMDLVRKGAPANLQSMLSFHLTEPGDLIVQPSMFGHAVLTFTGPAFVVGWEANSKITKVEASSASLSISSGVGVEEQRIVRNFSPVRQKAILHEIPNDAGEALRREAETGPLVASTSKFGRKPKKTRNLWGHKIAQKKKEQEKEGKYSLSFAVSYHLDNVSIFLIFGVFQICPFYFVYFPHPFDFRTQGETAEEIQEGF